MPPHWPLAQDKARYEGDAVAVVVADSRAAALGRGRADRGRVGAAARRDRRRARARRGRAARPRQRAVEQVLRLAARGRRRRQGVRRRRGDRQRALPPAAADPRPRSSRAACSRSRCPATGELTLWSATQVPHILRVTLSGVLGMPEAKLRVIAPDVGGGFGSKLNVYAEEALALALARRLGRPIKWIEERTEGFQATIHGRDVIQEIELAATEEGRITGVRVRLTAAMGAYLQLVTPGDPAARRVDLRRRLRHPRLRVRVHRRLHEHDADRRLPRRRPPRGDLRDRAHGRRARPRASARTRSRSAGSTSSRSSRTRSPRASRSTRATTTPTLDRALELAGYDALRARAGRAAGATATRSSSGSASRPTTRCAGSRPRGSSARSATARAAGTRPRSAACRPARCRC